MKRIGLLGGMSWESTLAYYRIINQVIGREKGGLHSADLVLVSLDFDSIAQLQAQGDWQTAGRRLQQRAQDLQAAGADFIVLCTNTMHRVADAIEAGISIPLLHIADATAAAIEAAGIQRVGLLGTRFTMEQTFYRDRLEERGLNVCIPCEDSRACVHRVIYEELCHGRVLEASREAFQRIVGELAQQGCGGVILGCTEIGMLLRPEDCPLPLFDTAELHARWAAREALAED